MADTHRKFSSVIVTVDKALASPSFQQNYNLAREDRDVVREFFYCVRDEELKPAVVKRFITIIDKFEGRNQQRDHALLAIIRQKMQNSGVELPPKDIEMLIEESEKLCSRHKIKEETVGLIKEYFAGSPSEGIEIRRSHHKLKG